MTQEFVMGAGGVPAGTYPLAEFIGAEDFENDYGKAVRLKWRIMGGEFDSQEASRICSPNMSAKSALGKMAVYIKGGPIAIGERFRFADYVGIRGSLAVEATQGGGGRVSVFLRQGQPTPAMAPPPATAAPVVTPPSAPPAKPQPTPQQLAEFLAWQQSQQQVDDSEVF